MNRSRVNLADLVAVREHFKFPFEPYAIQAEFMRSLTDALEQRALGLFESPTGTVRRSKNTLQFNQSLRITSHDEGSIG